MEEPELIPEPPADEQERENVLIQLADWLDTPMLVLAIGWFALFVGNLIYGPNAVVEVVLGVIWIIFIADFLVRFLIAPNKLRFVIGEWPMVLAMILPAFRVLRVFRAVRFLRLARAGHGVKLVRTVGSLNRGMGALKDTMGRRGFGYVLILTIAVVLTGAAGMQVFERGLEPEQGFTSYGDAVWWTLMMLTTVGAPYSPITQEGRILTFLIALYGFTIFGYLTATLATYFVDRDAEESTGKVASTRSVEALKDEIAALRADLKASLNDRRL